MEMPHERNIETEKEDEEEEEKEEKQDLEDLRQQSPRDPAKYGRLLTTWSDIDSELAQCHVPYGSGCA